MTNGEVCKIMLLDDHLELRDALSKLINDFGHCNVIGLAGNGAQMIDAITKGIRPQIVTPDINMPEVDGYAAAEWLKENHPNIKILTLTMYDSDVALIRLLRLGVRGFLKKDIHPNDLKIAIQTVTANDYYYSNTAAGFLTSFFLK